MSKELWASAFEELATEYLEANPEATWDEADAYAAERVEDRAANNMAAMIDFAWRLHRDRSAAA